MAIMGNTRDYPYRESWNKLPIYSVDEVIKRGYWLMKQGLTYSQESRQTSMDARVFDCSSYMATITGYSQLYPGQGPATPSMPSSYDPGYGYIYIYKDPRTPVDQNLFQKGDILIYTKFNTDGSGNNGHTALCLGNGHVLEMVGGGARDDRTYGTYPWQEVLRNPKSGFYPVKWEGN